MEATRTPVQTQAATSSRSQQLLIQTGLLLASEHDLRKIIQAATDAGRELSGAQFGAFFYNVTDPSGESYLLHTLSGVSAEQFAHFPMPRKTEVFAPTFSGQGIVRSEDITRDPRYGKSAPHCGMPEGHLPVCSYLAVPVISRSGEVLGGLFYGHSAAGIFAKESEDLVSTVAAQAAVAIENSRLQEQLARKIRDAELAEAQQQMEAQRVREVLEATSDAVVLLDRDWIIRYISPRAVQLIACGRDLLGQNLWHVFSDAVDSRFHLEYQRVMSERQPREFIEFYPPLGAWFSIRAFPTQQGIAIFFRDSSRAMEDDRARQENARRLRLALDAGQLGTWTWNRDTDLLDLDLRAAALYERDPHRPVSRTEIREHMIVAEDRALVAAALRRSLETDGTYTTEYRVQRRDGSIAWILAHGVALFDAGDSRMTGMIGTVQDITARKRQEQALRDSEKLAATGRMAATIAHEINNPLEAVTNLIFLARTHPAAAPEIRDHLDTADQELRRVSQIAQQTLGFYRDNSQPVPVDLGEAIRDVVAIFQRRLQSRRIDCVLDLRGPLHLSGQRGEIRQVLSNLLVNAIDVSPMPGAITVRARPARIHASGDSAVSILVCDRGSGIPASIRTNLFVPFFTTKREIGTGLGLWITKGIVEKHRGTIRFRSRTHRDPGTVFRVLLPTNLPAQA